MLDTASGPDGLPPGLVPVTVIGGYLGAGKTTMINRLLTGDHGLKLAVLVNDFGSVNVDAELIASHDGTTMRLENGCVCCTIADAMGDALDAVLPIKPDHILIEASGVADPAKVGIYGQGWPGCRLASIVVLADAAAIRQQSVDRFVGPLIGTQLRAADVIMLTKTDLISHAETKAVRSWLDTEGCTGPELPSDTTDLFETETMQLPALLSRTELNRLLSELPDSVVRAKGIVAVDGNPHVVQLTTTTLDITPAAPGATTTGLVIIHI